MRETLTGFGDAEPMASPTELARLAAAGAALRPDWPAQSLLTYLAKHHSQRAFQDLAVALAHIATDPTTETPARLSEPGPWWQATRTTTPTPLPPRWIPGQRLTDNEREAAGVAYRRAISTLTR